MSEKNKAIVNLNFETVGSVVAMLIGAAALFVAWDQAQVMRKQQHASVWPLLSPDFIIDNDETSLFLRLSVANDGVGPALVESAFLTLNGEKSTSQSEVMEFLFADTKPSGAANLKGGSIEKTVVGAGEKEEVFNIAWPINDNNIAAFTALANRYVAGEELNVSMTICYCSVFDRCFVANGNDRPERIRQCAAPTGFFTKLISDNQAADE